MPLFAALLLLAAQPTASDYDRGIRLFEAGRLSDAAAALNSAVKAKPGDAQAWKALGVVLAAQGDVRGAVEPFEKACALNRRLPDACYYLGRALYSLNRFEDALAPLNRALDADPVRGRSETALGECLEALGRNADAEKRLKEAVARRDASEERALTAYARFLIRAGRAEESLKHLERALRKSSGSPEAHFQMGRALLQLDRLEEAAKHVERTIQSEPNRAPARLLLARLYRRLGRADDAEREEKAALAIQQSTPDRDY